jgi:activating signal cointegrator complex subunit 1
MQNPSKASVLYAPPVDQHGVLQTFGEQVRKVFLDEGLLTEEDRPLLLHATLVNTIYVRSGGRRGAGGKKERITLDARAALDRYDDQVWMKDVTLEKIAICKMGAKKVSVDGIEDEEYEIEAEVLL